MADVIINTHPSGSPTFKTRSTLEEILDRLVLMQQDRRDLKHYIEYGGQENLEYIRNTIGDLLQKVPELNILIENVELILESLKKLDVENSFFEKGSGENSVVLKNNNNIASGEYSAVLSGSYNTASGAYSIASGHGTKAIGKCSNAKGYHTTASGQNSCAEGQTTKALGYNSHVEGYGTQAIGKHSHAEGCITTANNYAEHACGKFNVSNNGTIYSVGIGSALMKKNAHEILANGNQYIFNIGGYDGTNAVNPNEDGIRAKSIQEVVNGLGEVLNLSLGSSMTKEECLEIVNKLNVISKLKFYTINVYDKVETYNYGSFELFSIKDSYYRLIQNVITSTGNVQRYIYTFNFDGTYERQKTTYGSFADILKRLNTIEGELDDIPNIDPIVWKYLCNPIVIKDGEAVPEELLATTSLPKYYNAGMYRVEYENNIYPVIISNKYLHALFGNNDGSRINIEIINSKWYVYII